MAELTDLCALTPKAELSTEDISDADLQVLSAVPGEILFQVIKPVDEDGNTWTGIVNTLKFKAKINGQIQVNCSLE